MCHDYTPRKMHNGRCVTGTHWETNLEISQRVTWVPSHCNSQYLSSSAAFSSTALAKMEMEMRKAAVATMPPKSSPPPPVPANHPPPPTMHPVDYLRCDGSAGNGCGGKTLACPYQCPSTRPRDPAAKACYIDCHKCETSCRKRKPDCEGIGAACYDPRFVGGDGVMFYFHGKCNEDFSLVSDNHLQINAHFIGKRPEGRSRDYTWVQSLGIMFGTHTFTVGANKLVAKWDEKLDHLFFSFDNHPFTIPRGHLSVWDSPSGDLTVERTAKSNSVTVSIPKMLELSISVFKYLNLSPNVEGVLGQTYRPDFKNPVKVGVAMPIMGGEDKYRTSSLLSADCNLCKFWPNSSPAFERLLEESISGFDCSSKIGNAGHGIVCRK
eukprot:Gb_02718 [translate_table: standard]